LHNAAAKCELRLAGSHYQLDKIQLFIVPLRASPLTILLIPSGLVAAIVDTIDLFALYHHAAYLSTCPYRIVLRY